MRLKNLHRLFVLTSTLKISGWHIDHLQELLQFVTRTTECGLKSGVRVLLVLLYHGDVPGFEWRYILLVEVLYGLSYTRTRFCGFGGSTRKLHVTKSSGNYTPRVVVSFDLTFKYQHSCKGNRWRRAFDKPPSCMT